MLEKVFNNLLGIYKVSPQKLYKLTITDEVLFGEITIFLNTWKIILKKTSNGYLLSAVPSVPVFETFGIIDNETINDWGLIMEDSDGFSYPGPKLGKRVEINILEVLEKYPEKIVVVTEAVRDTLRSPEISKLYANYRFKE